MKKTSTLLSVALLALLPSCFTMNHQVGAGAQGTEVESDRQWYILWGLVELGHEVDSQEMAQGAADYDIETQWAPLDILMNFFTGIVSIHSRTTKVTH